MHWVRLAEDLLLPPGCLFWLAVVGLLLLLRRRMGQGLTLLAFSVLSLYLLSTPWTARLLLDSLDRYPGPAVGRDAAPADAVVVLGAGRRKGSGQNAAADISDRSIERLAHGADLARQLDIPLLISGRLIRDGGVSVLAEQFDTSPRWVEGESRNTQESAELSADLLREAGVRRVYLVSHYYHLPRAVAAFEREGLEIVPAPMGFAPPGSCQRGVTAVFPHPSSLRLSRAALHEMFGRLWYRLRYGV